MSRNSEKVKIHLAKIHKIKRATYGTWKCKICECICETRALLKQHNIDKHHCYSSVKKNTCPYCGKEFETGQKLGGHLRSCKKHPLKNFHDMSRKNAAKYAFKKVVNGELIPIWLGKHHTALTKRHMREAACKYLQNNNPTPCRYNKSAIPVLEQIAKEHGWNI